MLVEIRMCFPVRALSRFEREWLPVAASKSMKKYCFFETPLLITFFATRVPKGMQKGTFGAAFWGTFLEEVIFSKLMTVSNGMLTFACPGVPKTVSKSMKKGFGKLPFILDHFFRKKCSQRLPRGCPQGVKNPSKIDVLTNLAPTGPTGDHVDRFLVDLGSLLDPKLTNFGDILHPQTNERTEPTKSY